MSKNIDGIKKLSERELKKSRKIVLDYIGEEDKKNQTKKVSFINKSLKSIDGIKSGSDNKKNNQKFKKLAEKKVFENKDFFDELKNSQINKKIINKKRKNVESILPISKNQKIKNKEILKTNKTKKKEKEKQEKQEKNFAENKKKKKEKEIFEKRRKKKTLEKKKKQKQENEKKLKLKKEEDKKRKNEKQEEKRNKRKKYYKNIKKNIKSFFLNSFKTFKNKIFGFLKKLTFKKIISFLINFLLFLISLFLLLYLIFSFLVLRADIDIFEKLTSHIPVPAIISKDGIITYKEYDKNKDFLFYSETIVLNKLVKKYDLDIKKEDILNHKKIIEEKMVEDKEINKVAFMRIEDVKNAIKNNIDFDSIKERLGDESGILDSGSLKFFEKSLKNLKSGEISDFIKTVEGNYIFKKIGNVYHYLKINNINLDEYLKRQQKKIELFFLVE
jgi:hypothetical protein